MTTPAVSKSPGRELPEARLRRWLASSRRWGRRSMPFRGWTPEFIASAGLPRRSFFQRTHLFSLLRLPLKRLPSLLETGPPLLPFLHPAALLLLPASAPAANACTTARIALCSVEQVAPTNFSAVPAHQRTQPPRRRGGLQIRVAVRPSARLWTTARAGSRLLLVRTVQKARIAALGTVLCPEASHQCLKKNRCGRRQGGGGGGGGGVVEVCMDLLYVAENGRAGRPDGRRAQSVGDSR